MKYETPSVNQATQSNVLQEQELDRYEQLERDHLGDFDKRTGIYAEPASISAPAERSQIVAKLRDGSTASNVYEAFENGVKFGSAQATQPLDQNEQYRMQMAAISTAALGYWKLGDGIKEEYKTVALMDVAKLYEKYIALHATQPTQQAPAVNYEQIDALWNRYASHSDWMMKRIVREFSRDLLSQPAAESTKLVELCSAFGWRTDGDAPELADRIAHHIRDLKACIKAHEVTHASAPVSEQVVLEGWNIVRSKTEADRIIVGSPSMGGYVATKNDSSNIASAILYELAESILSTVPSNQSQGGDNE